MAMLLRFDPFQTFDRLSRELFSYPNRRRLRLDADGCLAPG
jgi:hypothetical protein